MIKGGFYILPSVVSSASTFVERLLKAKRLSTSDCVQFKLTSGDRRLQASDQCIRL